MEDIGIFEAKTKFPGLCDQVVRSGTPILVSRRGQPLVVVSPAKVPTNDESGGILDQWEAWEKQNPTTDPRENDFPEVWKMRDDKTEHPFED